MTLGEKIQQLRKASGLSQDQLAEQLDVSRQSISKWELNDAVPDVKRLIRLSELFDVSIDELLKENQQSKILNNGESKGTTTLIDIAKLNLAHKQITIGFITVIVGLIMFVLEYMFLPLFGSMQKSQVGGQGFYSDFIKYALVQPMPIIFTITTIVVIVGIVLIVKGYVDKKK